MKPLVVLLCALLLPACAGVPAVAEAEGPTFVVVRHGEKAGDDPRDPSLSEAGQARARALAALLADRDLVAAYATGLRRTDSTARPSAEAHALAITRYDPATPADAFAAQLRAAHVRGTVLVAGHSNTVPAIVGALCACPTTDMPESEYDRLNIVRVDAQGRARLEVSRYGAASAP